jgi:hypothetical protein
MFHLWILYKFQILKRCNSLLIATDCLPFFSFLTQILWYTCLIRSLCSSHYISFVRLGLLSCVCTFFLTWSLCLHSTVLATVSAMSWLITGELMWDNVRQVNYAMCYQSSTKSTQLPSWEGWSIQARLALQVGLLLKQHWHQYWSKKDSPWWAIPKVLRQDRPLAQLFGLVNDRRNLVRHCYHLKLFQFTLEFVDQVVRQQL